VLLSLLVLTPGAVRAQQLDPRAYSPAPIGANFAGVGALYSSGGIVADAALPDDVPAMREAKELLVRRSELLHSDGTAATAAVSAAWQRLDELAKAAGEQFPLSDAAARELRAGLRERVLALHAAEVAAQETLATVLQG
jgi:hypothetical protein